MQDTHAQLEIRIARLERRNRFLTTGCVVLAAAPLMLAFSDPIPKAPSTTPIVPTAPAGPETAELIKTRKLVVVDEDGKGVVVLTASKGAGSAVVLTKGKSQSELTGDGMAHYRWADEGLVKTVSLTKNGLTFLDGDKMRAKLEPGKLTLRDPNGTVGAQLAAVGGPTNLADLKLGFPGKAFASLGATSDSASVRVTGADPKNSKVEIGAGTSGGSIFAQHKYYLGGLQNFVFPVTGAGMKDQETGEYLFHIYRD
jgi:hypothetical protein